MKIFSFIVLVFALFQANAQEKNYQLINQETNQPVVEATVHIIFSNSKIETDEKGEFIINFNNEAEIEVRIISQGFESLSKILKTDDPTRVIYLTPQNNKLPEILISGRVFTDPVMNISTPDLTEKVTQPKNVADLFRDINGFGLIKRGNYAIDPSFRAAQYEQLNIQYDNGTKVMHACPNRMDPITTHVIPEDIAKIEVIRGPYSVRYGATFGGIINMVSKRPEMGNYGFSGNASSGFETNGNSMVNMLRLQYAEEKFDVVGMYGYRDFGNYEDGAGREIPSSFRSIDYSLRMGYNFSMNERLQLHWRQSFGRDVLHASLPMDSDFDDSSIISLDYYKKKMQGKLKGIQAKAYFSYVDHLMSNTRRSNFTAAEAFAPVEAITAGGRLELEWELAEKWKLFTGTDVLMISRDGVRNRLVKQNMMGMPLENPMAFTDKIWQDSYINDYGLFAESKYQINPSTILNAGIRYDLVHSESQDPEADFLAYYPDLDERFEHNFSGNISAKKILHKNHQLEIAYGRGVRSANMIERFINHFQVGQDPFEYIGNPNLDAEINNQFEIAYKGKKEVNSGINQINWGASVYYSHFENYIVALIDETKTRKFMPNQEPIHPKVFRNLDKAYKTGFEANFGLQFLKDFDFNANFAYVYARNEDLNESLPLTPPLRTTFSLQYNKGKFWAGTDLRLISEQTDLATSFGENQNTPAYELLDIRLGYEILPNLNLGAAALNVFDKQYFDHLNFAFRNQADAGLSGMERLTDPGRNFSFFVKYGF
jgi:iron complex outermembrane receptor protein